MNDSSPYSPSSIVLKPRVQKVNSDLITQFDVTSDSVVGIVRVKVRQTKEFRIDWGDGTSTRVRIGFPLNVLYNNAYTLLPDGTYEMRHAYEVPADGSSFGQMILLRAVSAT